MHLNYLPLRFTSDAFEGGIITFSGNPKRFSEKDCELSTKLRELRKEHRSTHFFYRLGNAIACIPLTPNAPEVGDHKQFTTITDFQLANALARNSVYDFLKNANHTVVAQSPVTVLLPNRNLASTRPDMFGIFPESEQSCLRLFHRAWRPRAV